MIEAPKFSTRYLRRCTGKELTQMGNDREAHREMNRRKRRLEKRSYPDLSPNNICVGDNRHIA